MSENHNQMLQLACGWIRQQAEKLDVHLGNLEQMDDPEPIHQARVSCRRLRQGLMLLGMFIERDILEDWDKAIRRLLKKLGPARDLDVHILFVKEVLSGLGPEQKRLRPGLERLCFRLGQQRQAIQKKLLKTARRFQKKQILMNIRLQGEKLLSVLASGGTESGQVFVDHFMDCCRHQAQDMTTRETALDDIEDCAGHHALRIAVKRFRYLLEIGNEITCGGLRQPLQTAKTYQTLLGELHDCDVWLVMLEEFEWAEKQRMEAYCGSTRAFGRLRPGLEHLRQMRSECRRSLFDHICGFPGRQNLVSETMQMLKSLLRIGREVQDGSSTEI
ncbi:CHAD domain-containing protein [Anaerohalosphaeraceae bacterium U12dextr]